VKLAPPAADAGSLTVWPRTSARAGARRVACHHQWSSLGRAGPRPHHPPHPM